jgi:hypothetical protein
MSTYKQAYRVDEALAAVKLTYESLNEDERDELVERLRLAPWCEALHRLLDEFFINGCGLSQAYADLYATHRHRARTPDPKIRERNNRWLAEHTMGKSLRRLEKDEGKPISTIRSGINEARRRMDGAWSEGCEKQ